MCLTTTSIMPIEYRVNDVTVLVPMSLIFGCHLIWPFVLDPYLSTFTVCTCALASFAMHWTELTEAVLDTIPPFRLFLGRAPSRASLSAHGVGVETYFGLSGQFLSLDIIDHRLYMNRQMHPAEMQHTRLPPHKPLRYAWRREYLLLTLHLLGVYMRFHTFCQVGSDRYQ